MLLLLVAAGGAAASHSSSSSSCPATPPDAGNTLQVSHAFGPCSPLGPGTAAPSWVGFLADQAAPSWAGFFADQASHDASRLLYQDLLAARGRTPARMRTLRRGGSCCRRPRTWCAPASARRRSCS